MSTISFIEARFFDPAESRFELETRLKRRLHLLRDKKLPPTVLIPPEDVLDDMRQHGPEPDGDHWHHPR